MKPENAARINRSIGGVDPREIDLDAYFRQEEAKKKAREARGENQQEAEQQPAPSLEDIPQPIPQTRPRHSAPPVVFGNNPRKNGLLEEIIPYGFSRKNKEIFKNYFGNDIKK
ncbi:hypothetical protein HZA33_00675 [Candidatus Pacearchaeota archaeon]|nr:hypothetical protein [Candidatus Pacearchaeota archaeon]